MTCETSTPFVARAIPTNRANTAARISCVVCEIATPRTERRHSPKVISLMADEERTGLLAEEHSEAPTPVVKPPTTYNPFGGGSSSTPTLSFPAVTTAATPAPAASPDLEALRLREADVARREAACLAREQALQRQLQQAQYRDERSATVAGDRQKNWPRCFPLIRHSIDEDIQEPTCRLVCRLSFMCFWCQAGLAARVGVSWEGSAFS